MASGGVASFRRIAAAALAVAVVTLIPLVALACPVCAGNERPDGARYLVQGSFMLLPFAVFGTVVWIVRRLQRSDSNPSDPQS